MNKFNPGEISDFARYYGFHYDGINRDALVKEVLIEMERGLSGESSSLPMIPSYITPVTRLPPGKNVLALDAGGTNLRTSLVHFNENGKAVAQGTKKSPMPGTNGNVNARQFFDTIADSALPLLKDNKTEGIGFTFSYPMEITADADGILLAFSKEVDAPDVIGKAVGKGLRDSLAAKGFKYDGPVVMLNDTVATLLSGVASISQEGGPVIGLILGTGFNTAYPETNIPKIGFNSGSAPQIVVCETGNFNVRYRGQLDREFDNTTKNPGGYFLEKACAGAYLGPLTLHILKQAVKDRIICFKRSDELLDMPHLETKSLSDFAEAPFTAENQLGALFGEDERTAIAGVQYITSIITERGALFSAATAAAAVRRLDKQERGSEADGFEPYMPVRIAIDGTTYMSFRGMRRSLESHLHQMLIRGKPRPYIVAPVEQASLFGAAVAALSH